MGEYVVARPYKPAFFVFIKSCQKSLNLLIINIVYANLDHMGIMHQELTEKARAFLKTVVELPTVSQLFDDAISQGIALCASCDDTADGSDSRFTNEIKELRKLHASLIKVAAQGTELQGIGGAVRENNISDIKNIIPTLRYLRDRLGVHFDSGGTLDKLVKVAEEQFLVQTKER